VDAALRERPAADATGQWTGAPRSYPTVSRLSLMMKAGNIDPICPTVTHLLDPG
jgi:hypothetical protein